MVRGFSIAVTAVPGVHQCAEMASIALGLGTESPRRRQACVYWFCANAFIGLPCPKNTAGIRAVLSGICVVLVLDYSAIDGVYYIRCEELNKPPIYELFT